MRPASYSSADLHRLLAHRHPLLLVDRVVVLEPGRRVVGTKLLSASEWWAQSDVAAPFPFVLVLEALAQTSGASLNISPTVLRELSPTLWARTVFVSGPL